jgi:hypothetical protein
MDALAHCLLPLAGYTKAAKNKKSECSLFVNTKKSNSSPYLEPIKVLRFIGP